LQDALKASDRGTRGVFLATAHPAKFREVVEPAIGRPVAMPQALEDAIKRPRTRTTLSADYADLERLIRAY